MKEEIIINPTSFEDKYIDYLNQCFTNWGNKEDYNWVFNRVVGDKKADILIIKDEDGDVIAGSGITYRKIVNNNKIEDIGILTGSWTLPKARGKGCFTKIISTSKEICKSNNVPYLTAFVMETNPSYRRLSAAGSSLLNSFTLFSPTTPYKEESNNVSLLKISEDKLLEEIYNKQKFEEEENKFSYNFLEFKNQYFQKNKKVEFLKISNNYAFIEESHNVIKLNYISLSSSSKEYLSVIKTLTNWALETRGKKLMIFTTLPEENRKLINLEFESLAGYFTVLNTQGSKNKIEKLVIEMGDKM